MRLFIIGVGQCGGRIADEFVRMNKVAKRNHDASFLVDAIAVNSDMADLLVLKDIKKDAVHRVVVGLERTGGHGTAKEAAVGAELMVAEGQNLLSAIRTNSSVAAADAFLLICGTAGGMGSGATPIIANLLRENFRKPIYAFTVLPFSHEEAVEERSSHNTAIALNTLYDACEAVFVADNALFMRQSDSLNENMNAINRQYVGYFTNFLLSGESKKYAANLALGVGELLYNLKGFCVLARGIAELNNGGGSFNKRSARIQSAIHAMEAAIGQPTCHLNLKETPLVYMICNVEAKKIDEDMLKDVSQSLKNACPNANVIISEYNRTQGNVVDMSLLFVDNDLSIVHSYYEKGTELQMRMDEREKSRREEKARTDDLAKDLPLLLDF
ncbi:MAG: hypothetical protein FWF37_01110 [Chloroflexi bacterium]|nr:hypothetical protein [Chloroflexota bacterium]